MAPDADLKPRELEPFQDYLKSIRLNKVRDVNEHGFDAGAPRSSPSIYA
jgi:hypothetical protein